VIDDAGIDPSNMPMVVESESEPCSSMSVCTPTVSETLAASRKVLTLMTKGVGSPDSGVCHVTDVSDTPVVPDTPAVPDAPAVPNTPAATDIPTVTDTLTTSAEKRKVLSSLTEFLTFPSSTPERSKKGKKPPGPARVLTSLESLEMMMKKKEEGRRRKREEEEGA